jgi:HTH-type transcriptional regulator/antitoxin HigA
MELRVIKSQEQYHRYLEEARALVRRDPDPQTPEGARLELLALLIEDYEKKRFKFRKPDPVEAILFRMEQQGQPAAEYRVSKKRRKTRSKP